MFEFVLLPCRWVSVLAREEGQLVAAARHVHGHTLILDLISQVSRLFSKCLVNFVSLGEGGGEKPGDGFDGEQEGAGERRGGLPGGEEGRGLDVSIPSS